MLRFVLQMLRVPGDAQALAKICNASVHAIVLYTHGVSDVLHSHDRARCELSIQALNVPVVRSLDPHSDASTVTIHGVASVSVVHKLVQHVESGSCNPLRCHAVEVRVRLEFHSRVIQPFMIFLKRRRGWRFGDLGSREEHPLELRCGTEAFTEVLPLIDGWKSRIGLGADNLTANVLDLDRIGIRAFPDLFGSFDDVFTYAATTIFDLGCCDLAQFALRHREFFSEDEVGKSSTLQLTQDDIDSGTVVLWRAVGGGFVRRFGADLTNDEIHRILVQSEVLKDFCAFESD